MKKKPNRSMKLAVKVERGSGNVFQDLSLPDAQERLAKAELAHAICGVIEAAGWTQSQAAARLGIDQPKISSLMRGRLRDFSTERLMRYLTMLDRDVVILIQNPGRNRPAAVRVLSRAS